MSDPPMADYGAGANGLQVALLYNLKHPATLEPDAPIDALALYDTVETVQMVEDALRRAGHDVVPLEADHTLIDTIRHVNPDICFNMARSTAGSHREAQIPALLEMLNIPYTGSDVLCQALAQDKAATKRAWQERGLPTAPWQIMNRAAESLGAHLAFPLFVKPQSEGANMGISAKAVVHDVAELCERVERVLHDYQQPAMVEQYLPGREFTVGVLGNRTTGRNFGASLRRVDGYRTLPIAELVPLECSTSMESTAYRRIICPAEIELSLAAELEELAIAAFEAIGAQDVACLDIRLDEHGEPRLIEINAMPRFSPEISRLAIMTAAQGVDFADLIVDVLNLALERNQLVGAPAAIGTPNSFLWEKAEMNAPATAAGVQYPPLPEMG